MITARDFTDEDQPGRVLIALIADSPWPEDREACQGYEPEHAASFVIWTNVDTGDGMRYACGQHMGGWAQSVAARLWDVT